MEKICPVNSKRSEFVGKVVPCSCWMGVDPLWVLQRREERSGGTNTRDELFKTHLHSKTSNYSEYQVGDFVRRFPCLSSSLVMVVLGPQLVCARYLLSEQLSA